MSSEADANKPTKMGKSVKPAREGMSENCGEKAAASLQSLLRETEQKSKKRVAVPADGHAYTRSGNESTPACEAEHASDPESEHEPERESELESELESEQHSESELGFIASAVVEPDRPGVRRAEQWYDQAARRVTILPHDQISALLKLAAEGDKVAANKLDMQCLPTVVRIARRFRTWSEEEDLIGIGMVAVANVRRTFRQYKGSFLNYAGKSAKYAMLEYRRQQKHVASVSARGERKRCWVIEASEALAETLGRLPSRQEIANETGLTVDEVRELENIPERVSPRDDEEVEAALNELESLIADWRPEWLAESEVLLHQLDSLTDNVLDDTERAVVLLRYGLGDDCLSRTDIGRGLGLTKKQLRRIEAKALTKLREHMLNEVAQEGEE